MSFANDERRHLAALLLELGPDAPTLCEGWSTRDLAAHLWVREHEPRAASGMVISKAAPRLEEAMDRARERDYAELVNAWSSGPSRLNPLRLADPLFNYTENFIHHEDVRRANGRTTSRDLPARVEENLNRLLAILGKRLLAKSTIPIALRPTGFAPVIAGPKGRVDGTPVEVFGPIGDIVLWVFGRDAVNLTITGDSDRVVRASM